jgi:hypothetical protein
MLLQDGTEIKITYQLAIRMYGRLVAFVRENASVHEVVIDGIQDSKGIMREVFRNPESKKHTRDLARRAHIRVIRIWRAGRMAYPVAQANI